jgi:protein Tex
MEVIIKLINKVCNISEKQISNTIELFKEGATIPFISRYRKEKTSGLDESQIEEIQKEFKYFTELTERKKYIIDTIDKSGNLSDELRGQIENSWDANEIEDLYLPYKPKKRTRAQIAINNGLEPLADIILAQKDINIKQIAANYLNENISKIDEAIAGASDIIAERVSENKSARERIRNLFAQESKISSKLIKTKIEEAEKYKDYFDFEQKLENCPSHRILAIRRGEREGFLRVDISPNSDNAIKLLKYLFVKNKNHCGGIVLNAVEDAYKRLLKPSIENEFAKESKLIADIKAIEVFANNLRQLLLSPPLGQKRIIGIDPGYRSGCKVVCVDEQGKLLHNENIYPHKPQEEVKMAAKKVSSLIETFKIEAIAIGNGTASRETESFIKRLKFKHDVRVYVVSEDGASIYSASPAAREEFPQYDVTVRGAVSIARRLMDPLAELVKIDPKSIGVGQYQHDVDQKLLKESLDRVVESCVNNVGVNLNTSSKHLLTYIAGLGPALAQNIVEYRNENGAFQSRKELLEVKRLGKTAFQQCAGFLRIPDAENPLDNTAVHPESYIIAKKMAKDLKVNISDLANNDELISKIIPENYITGDAGLPTIKDIIKELGKPGRDPRKIIKVFEFDKSIYKIEDLKEGMILPGIVTNVTNFGAFVDIGIKENGLIHISQMADAFVSDPSEVVSVHQQLMVKVTEVDIDRKRIQLSLKGMNEE